MVFQRRNERPKPSRCGWSSRTTRMPSSRLPMVWPVLATEGTSYANHSAAASSRMAICR